MLSNRKISGSCGMAVGVAPDVDESTLGQHNAGGSARMLSRREATAIQLLALGTPIKVIIGQLNISAYALASYVSRAKKKLAVGSRAALQIAVIGNPAPADVRSALSHWLTSAEMQVVEGILVGMRNAAIAEKRGTSIRTVENQIAKIFHKLRVRSRFELLPRVISLVQGKHL